MKEIANYFEPHYSSVNKIIKAAENSRPVLGSLQIL
jgi:hypothetical protein